MRKIVYIGVFLIVLGVFFTFYEEKCMALEKKKYYEKINDNIDMSYKTVILEIGEIRQEMLQMQSFFTEDPCALLNVIDRYYGILTNISNRLKNLNQYVYILEQACSRHGDVYNEQCLSYSENVKKLQDNYHQLLLDYNAIIREYNFRQNTNLELFEG